MRASHRVVPREERPREVGERPREVGGDELREVFVRALDRDRDVARDVAVGDREAAVEELRELRWLALSLRRDDGPREVIDREVVDRPRERDVLSPELDRDEPPLLDRPSELRARDVLLCTHHREGPAQSQLSVAPLLRTTRVMLAKRFNAGKEGEGSPCVRRCEEVCGAFEYDGSRGASDDRSKFRVSL